MMLGSVKIHAGFIETHRDSYSLDTLRVTSVRLPFLAPSLMIGSGLSGFCWSFVDLLYIQEILVLGGTAAIVLLAGFSIGQLSFLSTELRGTEQSNASIGTRPHLNRIRRQITAAKRASGSDAAS